MITVTAAMSGRNYRRHIGTVVVWLGKLHICEAELHDDDHKPSTPKMIIMSFHLDNWKGVKWNENALCGRTRTKQNWAERRRSENKTDPLLHTITLALNMMCNKCALAAKFRERCDRRETNWQAEIKWNGTITSSVHARRLATSPWTVSECM